MLLHKNTNKTNTQYQLVTRNLQGFRNAKALLSFFLQGFRNGFWQGFRNKFWQGFRIKFWQGFRTKNIQSFRIVFYIAFPSSLQSLRNNFNRAFVPLLQGYRNVKAFSVVSSQMLLTEFHIEISDLSKL